MREHATPISGKIHTPEILPLQKASDRIMTTLPYRTLRGSSPARPCRPPPRQAERVTVGCPRPARSETNRGPGMVPTHSYTVVLQHRDRMFREMLAALLGREP